MPIFNLSIESLGGKASEKIQVTGTKLRDFITVRRPDINKLKEQYEHTKDKRFYKQIGDEYPIHVIRRQYLLSNTNRRSIQGTTGRPNCGRNDLWLGNPWWKRLK